ncbi:MAG: DUF3857 domain-containing protein [Cytophagia bacterium]|nr:MAG: DUF3857 domain-containing protein [Cytophagia bacterium]TAG43860.1 MAG: DUF3857 domain-containing protein [Cytophagia bacterium]
MKRKLILVALFFNALLSLLAQNNNYSIHSLRNSVSAFLLENADAIIRNEETQFIIQDKGQGIIKVKYVCTILNKDGDDEGVITLSQGKLEKIQSLEGKLYDADGNLVAKLKKSDIENVGYQASYEVNDNKTRVAKFSYAKYPYTVAFEYELLHKNMMFYPTFKPQGNSKLAVESASLEIIAPKNLPVRYKENNMPQKVRIMSENNKTSYFWKVENINVPKKESFSMPWYTKTPHVLTAPTEFEVEGYEGKLSTWKDFGYFNNVLNKDRDVLPEQIQKYIQKMVANETDEYTKVKKIYEYMQSKTRYVSIQLGIGGWQTLPAEFVDNKGYGDCKALSNYTKSLLKTVGINSHYTLIRAGENRMSIDKDFVSSQFNHVILCVPTKKDTIWLECTSQRQPFNFLGSFTDDRHALLITEDGGKLVKTPNYTQKENIQTTSAKIKIKEEGEAEVSMNISRRGLQTENNGIDHVFHQSEEIQKKWLYENLELSDFELINFSIKEAKDENKMPIINQSANLKIKKLVAKTGKRLFLTPNLMNKRQSNIEKQEGRITDIYIDKYEYTDIDTLQYEIPEVYYVEGVAQEHHFTSVFGEYETKLKIEKGKLTYIRKLSMKKGTYPKEKYKELIEFYNNIYKADNAKIVFVKST